MSPSYPSSSFHCCSSSLQSFIFLSPSPSAASVSFSFLHSLSFYCFSSIIHLSSPPELSFSFVFSFLFLFPHFLVLQFSLFSNSLSSASSSVSFQCLFFTCHLIFLPVILPPLKFRRCFSPLQSFIFPSPSRVCFFVRVISLSSYCLASFQSFNCPLLHHPLSFLLLFLFFSILNFSLFSHFLSSASSSGSFQFLFFIFHLICLPVIFPRLVFQSCFSPFQFYIFLSLTRVSLYVSVSSISFLHLSSLLSPSKSPTPQSSHLQFVILGLHTLLTTQANTAQKRPCECLSVPWNNKLTCLQRKRIL